MVNIRLILDLSEGPALCCEVQWPTAPRVDHHVKLPTHAEYSFRVKSVEWTMHGAARVILTPKADIKHRQDLMSGRDLWQSEINQGFPYPQWKEYFYEKYSSTPYKK